jgi:hypothetical protein
VSPPDGGNAPDAGRAPARAFIPIDDVAALLPHDGEPPSVPADPAPAFLLGDPVEGWETRTSLFGDAER